MDPVLGNVDPMILMLPLRVLKLQSLKAFNSADVEMLCNVDPSF